MGGGEEGGGRAFASPPPPSPAHIPGSHAVFNHLFGPIIADLIESNTKGARRGGSDSLVYSPPSAANDRLLFWRDNAEELCRLLSFSGSGDWCRGNGKYVPCLETRKRGNIN